MTIRARFTLDGTIPLARTRIAYDRGRLNPAQTVLMTDVNGNAVINRDERAGGVQVNVFAANPVAEVVTTRLNTEVRTSVQANDGSTESIVSVPDRRFYVIAEMARTIYNGTFRLFTRFPGESPTGSLSNDPPELIRIKFPDQSPATISFTDPHGQPSRTPVIHLEGVANATTGALVLSTLESHLVSELAHALHFQSLPVTRRKAIRIRYLKALGIDLVEDGDIAWSDTQADTRISAFIEALDLFANQFHFEATGTTLAAREADYFTNVAPAFVTRMLDETARGDDVPGAVCATIFADYAGSTSVGLDAALNQYFTSGASTYAQFERFIHRTFGVGSPQEIALSAAAGRFGLV